MPNTRITANANQIPVDICGSSDYGRYNKVSSARTFNMFITTAGSPQAPEVWLVNFAGYRKALTVNPNSTCRGLFHSTRGNFLLIVVGNIVAKIDTNLNQINVGTLLTNTTGEVFIAENLNEQICIVDGTYAYVYNYNTNAFAQFVDSAGQPIFNGSLVPSYVEYHNTYFLFGNAFSNTTNNTDWFGYAPGSGTSLTYKFGLPIQTKADAALAVKRLPGQGNNVVVMGNVVSEIWTQIAGNQFYVRNPTRNIDFGCASVSTIAEGDRYLTWLAQNQDESIFIAMYDGESFSRISTDGIDYLLSRMQFPSQSTAMMYRLDGHLIYQLTFFNSVDNTSIIYDFNTQKFFDVSDQNLNYHPARNVVYFNLKQYFCSLNNGSLYQMSTDITYINENEPGGTDTSLIYDCQRVRITPSIREATSTRFIANSLVLTLEQGTDPNWFGNGLSDFIITEDTNAPADADVITETGADLLTENSTGYPYSVPGISFTGSYYQPRIDLQISKDGGITWSNSVARILNPLGYRKNILHWESMGVANDLCFKFRFWGTYRFIVNDGLCDIIS